MQFEVFNRKTEKAYSPTLSLTVDLSNRRIRIPASTVAGLSLSKGDSVTFLRMGKSWYLAKTNKDGFTVRIDNDKGTGAFNATHTARILMADIARGHMKAECYLQRTTHEYNTHPVYELLKKAA